MPTTTAPAAQPATAMIPSMTGVEAPGNMRLDNEAASPPMMNAPSPPMMAKPICAGSAKQSAVSSSGAARTSVFCQENQVPKPPSHISP